MENKNLWLNEAMNTYKKKFKKGTLNILNAPAGCGKTTFIFNDFLTNTSKYINYEIPLEYKFTLDKVLYVCDTTMLKESVISENKELAKSLDKGDLSKAKDEITLKGLINNKEHNGIIKVVTYSKLGILLQNEACKYLILNHFKCIIFDEMHNLFKYANRFDNEEKRTYGVVVDCIEVMSIKTLLIGMSATIGRIYNGIRNLSVKTNTIFESHERQTLKQLNYEPIETNNIMNYVKHLTFFKQYMIDKNYKIFIYTNTIKQSEKYIKWCRV